MLSNRSSGSWGLELWTLDTNDDIMISGRSSDPFVRRGPTIFPANRWVPIGSRACVFNQQEASDIQGLTRAQLTNGAPENGKNDVALLSPRDSVPLKPPDENAVCN